MFRALLVGVPVLLLCVLGQAMFLGWSLRIYGRRRPFLGKSKVAWPDMLLLTSVMLVLLLGNIIPMLVWAALFVAIGAIGDFSTAFYHSAVNFVTLGYGDIVMPGRWRMLGPMESATGIMMFGVSTAVMTAAVMDIIKLNRDSLGIADD
jgi:hypothetical protein